MRALASQHRRVLASRIVWVLVCTVGAGCGARTDALDRGGRAGDGGAGVDASRPSDAATADAPPALDAAPPDVPPPPLECVAREGAGRIVGSTPLGSFAFPYVVAGVEQPTTHSCPRLFLRAGSDPAFAGDYLEIEVPYSSFEPRGPGTRMGFLNLNLRGEVWSEPIMIDVHRADGLFEGSPPRMDEWRASASIAHHDATSDIDGEVVDAEYCWNFALCL